jgi:hypothetical protein
LVQRRDNADAADSPAVETKVKTARHNAVVAHTGASCLKVAEEGRREELGFM